MSGLDAAGRGGLDRAGDRVDLGVGVAVGEGVVEEAGQLGQLLGEIVRALVQPLGPAQRRGGGAVGARRTAQAQIDPAGGHRLQGAELLGDHQRGVVGQHHAAGAETDALGVGGEVGEEHGGRGGGDAGHGVVLGDPVAVEATAFGRTGDVDGRTDRAGSGVAGPDRHQVEHGQRDRGAAQGRAPYPVAAFTVGLFAAPGLVTLAAHGAGPPRVSGLRGG